MEKRLQTNASLIFGSKCAQVSDADHVSFVVNISKIKSS